MDPTPRDDVVALEPVDAGNWRDVCALEVHPEQHAFVASPGWYLALCTYGDDWRPLAIRAHGRIVGMMMWAFDADEGATWFGGVVVDRRWQRQGIGRRAIAAAIERFEGDASPGGLALSYRPENDAARRTYAPLGFVETGEAVDGEVVARRR